MKNLKNEIQLILSQHQFNHRHLYWLSNSSITTPGDDSQFQQLTFQENITDYDEFPSDSPFHDIQDELYGKLLTFDPNILNTETGNRHPDYQYKQIITNGLISHWETNTGSFFRIQITDHTLYIIQVESSI